MSTLFTFFSSPSPWWMLHKKTWGWLSQDLNTNIILGSIRPPLHVAHLETRINFLQNSQFSTQILILVFMTELGHLSSPNPAFLTNSEYLHILSRQSQKIRMEKLKSWRYTWYPLGFQKFYPVLLDEGKCLGSLCCDDFKKPRKTNIPSGIVLEQDRIITLLSPHR